MKKLLTIALLSTMFTQAFAGILENRRTGETLEFNLNRGEQTIDVLSTSSLVANKQLKLNGIDRSTRSHNLLALSRWSLCMDDMYQGGCSGPEPLLLPITFTLDVVSMPIRLSSKLIQSARNNKDYKSVMRAINSTSTIVVSDKRFTRITNLLN